MVSGQKSSIPGLASNDSGKSDTFASGTFFFTEVILLCMNPNLLSIYKIGQQDNSGHSTRNSYVQILYILFTFGRNYSLMNNSLMAQIKF